MNYLSIENITYKTRLTEDELIKRLENMVKPRGITFRLFSKGMTKTYKGEINRPYFAIHRIIWFRNSFLPRITGTMLSIRSKTDLQKLFEAEMVEG